MNLFSTLVLTCTSAIVGSSFRFYFLRKAEKVEPVQWVLEHILGLILRHSHVRLKCAPPLRKLVLRTDEKLQNNLQLSREPLIHELIRGFLGFTIQFAIFHTPLILHLAGDIKIVGHDHEGCFILLV